MILLDVISAVDLAETREATEGKTMIATKANTRIVFPLMVTTIKYYSVYHYINISILFCGNLI